MKNQTEPAVSCRGVTKAFGQGESRHLALRGVTLRSALRLLLKDLELSYLIQDEVIQITTPEDASAQVSTKVYPVGDLVVPVQPPPNQFTPGGLGPMNGGGANTMNGPANPLNPGNTAMPPLNGPRFGPPF